MRGLNNYRTAVMRHFGPKSNAELLAETRRAISDFERHSDQLMASRAAMERAAEKTQRMVIESR
jgi:hypothetical protein